MTQPKKTLFIANWKMAKPFADAISFCKNHHADIVALSQKDNISIAIVPDFIALDHLVQSFSQTNITIGAQNCSAYDQGAHTGQVSAQSIAQTGASFCLIGHNEVRTQLKQTDHDVAQSLHQVLQTNLFPIICIGETKRQREENLTFSALEKQLQPVFDVLRQQPIFATTIAYEPVWAIGSGKPPTKSDIEDVLLYIRQLWEKQMENSPLNLVYGGSVNKNSIESLKQISNLDGFLIGSASWDFQEFEKIVNLFTMK